MTHLSRAAVFILFVVAYAVLITCSSDDSDTPSGPSSPEIFTPSVGATSLSPATYVEVTGIPAGLDDLYGVVVASDSGTTTMAAAAEADTGYTVLIRTDSGDYIAAPLNPSDPLAGGEVLLIISDGGEIVSAPVLLTLDTLPAAPGETQAIVSLLQEQLTHMMRLAGTSRDSLGSLAPADIPLQHLPLYASHYALDNPDNPNNMRAMVDGTASGYTTDSAGMELADRILATTGYREYLEDMVQRLDTMAALDSLPGRRKTLGEAASAGQACIDPPDLNITNCELLADAMRLHGEMDAAKRDLSNKVKADAANLGMLMVSLVPGTQAPATIIGGSFWIESKIEEGFYQMLPSSFVDAATSFDPTKDEFTEDFTEDGKWTMFNVTARSLGWKLDALILDAITQALGAKGAFDAWDEVPPGTIGEIVDQLDETAKGAYIGMGTGQVINEFAGPSGIIEICPNTWSNIDCVDPNLSDVSVLNGPLTTDEIAGTYRPTDIGESRLRIETSDLFGSNNTRTDIVIQTNEIEVHIDPFQAEADTNQSLTFNVRVENAEDTRVQFFFDGDEVGDESSAQVTTPGAPWEEPLELRAVSLAATGLRLNAGDERDDVAFITYQGEGEAFISPNFICVKSGTPQEFVVSYTGSSIDSVRWELDPPGFGSLNESGGPEATYNAPSGESGNVLVKATVNGASTAIADVSVSSCVCAWTFEAEGAGYGYSESGNWASAGDLGGLSVTLKETEDGFRPFLSFVSYNALDTGTFDVEAFYFEDINLESWDLSDTTLALPQVTITAFKDGDYAEGVITGQLSNRTNFNPPEYDYITFSLTFRSEFFNLDRPKCVDD